MSHAIQDLSGSLPDVYAIDREIGRGGMAVVFLATDRRLGRQVAIKVLKPEIAHQLGAERFLREIEIVGRLSHPHILPLLDSGESGETLWYAMPYVEGEALSSVLGREGALPVERAVVIARDVARALSWAHGHGIIHRDIKPANILLDGDDAIVADFGLARAIHVAGGESLTSSGLVVGTPAYMSPEQVDARAELDGRSDVYSLGCTLYEMLAGQPPFLGASSQAIVAQHLGAPIPSIRVLRPSVPAWLDEAVLKSLAKVPADRFESAEAFAVALSQRKASSRRRSLRTGAVIAVVLLLTMAGLLGRRALHTPAALDRNLVAVAPFEAFDAGLALWREGMVDILSSNLDGAGPLRSVSPSVVIRNWHGRADNATALRLARSKGAGLVVLGRLLRSSGDSVRANVVLLDVASGQRLGEIEQRESLTRMDRLGDSLTVALLQQAGQTVEARTRRLSSLGTASLPALKAFLHGEHFLRQASWDSALSWYKAAIQADSSFALALWRTQMAMAWLNWGLQDPQGDAFALRAGAFNHGLAPRESLLITVDSLWSSLWADDSLVWRRARRVFSTLDEAIRRYPRDPFVWYQVGAARYSLAPPLDYTMRQSLDAFDRAIALDSGFAVAYLTRPVQLALILEGVKEARRYTRGYLQVSTLSVEDSAARLSDYLLGGGSLSSREIQPLVGSASADVLYRAASTLDMWFDYGETAVRLAQLMVQGGRPRSAEWGDEQVLRLRLARLLAQRGHLERAYREFKPLTDHRSPGDENLELFTELALLDIIPADSARQVFRDWLRASPRGALFAMPWWSQMRDTVALRLAAAVQDSLAKAGDSPARRGLARYGVQAAHAYEALARADTALAAARFAQLPDSLCQDCYLDWKTHAMLLLQRHQVREARRLLTRVVTFAWTVPSYAGASLLLGRAEESMGDKAAASRAYRATVDAWASADSRLTPQVEAARKALARLQST